MNVSGHMKKRNAYLQGRRKEYFTISFCRILDSPGQDVFIQYTFCIKLLRDLKKAALEAIYTKLYKKLGFNTVNAKYVIKYWLWCKGIAFTEAI